MGIRLTVKGDQVSGNNKGGEDLFLVFTATEDTALTGLEIELEDGELSWDTDDETTWRVKTYNYDFEWEGTKDDLTKLFDGFGGNDPHNWKWTGPVTKAPVKHFKYRHYVSGNAD